MTDNNNNEVGVETNRDYFVTTTTFDHDVVVEELMEELRKRKTTGDLCFHLNKGGVRRIELNERKPVNGESADQIREILNMD